MARRVLRLTATGLAGMAVCFGFGWSMAETAASLTRRMERIR